MFFLPVYVLGSPTLTDILLGGKKSFAEYKNTWFSLPIEFWNNYFENEGSVVCSTKGDRQLIVVVLMPSHP